MVRIPYRSFEISLVLKRQPDGLGWSARAIIFEASTGMAVKAIENRDATLLLQEKDAHEKALQLAKAWINGQASSPTDNATKRTETVDVTAYERPDARIIHEMDTMAGLLFLPTKHRLPT